VFDTQETSHRTPGWLPVYCNAQVSPVGSPDELGPSAYIAHIFSQVASQVGTTFEPECLRSRGTDLAQMPEDELAEWPRAEVGEWMAGVGDWVT
jgi:hypothetical protein